MLRPGSLRLSIPHTTVRREVKWNEDLRGGRQSIPSAARGRRKLPSRQHPYSRERYLPTFGECSEPGLRRHNRVTPHIYKPDKSIFSLFHFELLQAYTSNHTVFTTSSFHNSSFGFARKLFLLVPTNCLTWVWRNIQSISIKFPSCRRAVFFMRLCTCVGCYSPVRNRRNVNALSVGWFAIKQHSHYKANKINLKQQHILSPPTNCSQEHQGIDQANTRIKSTIPSEAAHREFQADVTTIYFYRARNQKYPTSLLIILHSHSERQCTQFGQLWCAGEVGM